MNRLITVKGTGNVSVKPDLMGITMEIESHCYGYDDTMTLAMDSLKKLQEAIELAGFTKSDLKTSSFNINTHYESYRDKNDNYKNKFDGYLCEQGLKLEFDFDTDTLSQVLNQIGKTEVEPELRIYFSVKDKDAVNKELLIRATKNAREKGEILATASMVKLGALISIDYNWVELQFNSPTQFRAGKNFLLQAQSINIEPEDIDLSDTVSFVWEIK